MKVKFQIRTLDEHFEMSETLTDVVEECEDCEKDPLEYYSTTEWIHHNKLESFNGKHGIYGNVESLHQSDQKPGWLDDYDLDQLEYRIVNENND